jgi:hypothetical protein
MRLSPPGLRESRRVPRQIQSLPALKRRKHRARNTSQAQDLRVTGEFTLVWQVSKPIENATSRLNIGDQPARSGSQPNLIPGKSRIRSRTKKPRRLSCEAKLYYLGGGKRFQHNTVLYLDPDPVVLGS